MKNILDFLESLIKYLDISIYFNKEIRFFYFEGFNVIFSVGFYGYDDLNNSFILCLRFKQGEGMRCYSGQEERFVQFSFKLKSLK